MTSETLVKKAEMPPFSVARACREIFLYEINGAGIAWQFDHTPKDFGTLLEFHIAEHLEDTTELRVHINRFNRYRDLLKGFVPFPIKTQVYDVGKDDGSLKEITRCIEPGLIERYDAFSESLEAYAASVDGYLAGESMDSDTVLAAAASVCAVVRPSDWESHAEGDAPIENLRSGGESRWYLEAVMSENVATQA